MPIKTALCAFGMVAFGVGCGALYDDMNHGYQPDVWKISNHPKYKESMTVQNLYTGKYAHPLEVYVAQSLNGNVTSYSWRSTVIDVPLDERNLENPWVCRKGEGRILELFNSITKEAISGFEVRTRQALISSNVACSIQHKKYGKITAFVGRPERH
jgi:hypothetical protein